MTTSKRKPTRRPAAPVRRTSAEVAVVACNAILQQMEGIAVLIGELKDAASNAPHLFDWGYVGSLGHVAELLDEIEKAVPEAPEA